MNNFNSVFACVQKHCREQGGAITGPEHLQKIAAETPIPIDRLPFYLDCLSNIGLIHYSENDKKVSLTNKGKTTKYVFPNDESQ